MNPSAPLTDALGTLARDRAAVLARLDAMTPEQRAFRPAPDAWSAADVADHLAKAESGQIEIVRRQVAAPRPLGRPSAPRRWLVERIMRSGVRVRMPAAVAPRVTPTGVPFEASRDALVAAADGWRALAATYPPAMADAGVFAHPVAGPLTLRGTVGFAAAHLDHHRRQIERICRTPGFPAGARETDARPARPGTP